MQAGESAGAGFSRPEGMAAAALGWRRKATTEYSFRWLRRREARTELLLRWVGAAAQGEGDDEMEVAEKKGKKEKRWNGSALHTGSD